jgi:hypothetical protein
MTRKVQMNVSIDADLLERIDRVAAKRHETRSAVIDRFCRNQIDDDEQFLAELEQPVVRALYSVMAKPEVLRVVAALVGDKLTGKDVEAKVERMKRQLKLGKERGLRRRRSGTAEGDGSIVEGV